MSAEATEHLQEQGGKKRQQKQIKPQTPAEGSQECVPLQVREVWLPDQQVVPVCIYQESQVLHLLLGEIQTCTTVLYGALHETYYLE